MFKVLENIFKSKIVTENITTKGSERYRGQLEGDCPASCLGACQASCPVGAFAVEGDSYKIDYKKCIFCGQCIEAVAKQAEQQAEAAGLLHHKSEDVLPELLIECQTVVSGQVQAKLGRALNVRHLDAGSCNACDFEMGALSNPIYDLHRYGIAFSASPRHVDLLMVTGVVTRNLEQALKMTYEAMEEPKLVMACGACAAGGATYGDTYAIVGPVDKILPVDIYVPGCPPRPSAMIIALIAAADLLNEKLNK